MYTYRFQTAFESRDLVIGHSPAPQAPGEDMERKIEVGFRVLSRTEYANLPEPIEQTVIIAGRRAEPSQFTLQIGEVQLPRQFHGCSEAVIGQAALAEDNRRPFTGIEAEDIITFLSVHLFLVFNLPGQRYASGKNSPA